MTRGPKLAKGRTRSLSQIVFRVAGHFNAARRLEMNGAVAGGTTMVNANQVSCPVTASFETFQAAFKLT
jgi:hypothetical protein